jgi:hypothetical protein
MTKLTDKEKKRRAAERLKVREQKFVRKQWAEKLEPEFRQAITNTHIFLGSGGNPAWRENAPPHLLKVKPLIDKIYRSMNRRG